MTPRPDPPPQTEASVEAAQQAAQRERDAHTRQTGDVIDKDGRLVLVKAALAALAIASTLLSATPASAQDRKFTLALIAYDVAGTTDVASTAYLMGRGTVREVGFAPFVNQPIAFSATKLGVLGAVNYALIGLRPKHPRWAFWIAVAGAAAETSLSLRNARLAGGR